MFVAPPPVSYPSTSFLYLFPTFCNFLKKGGCSPYILPLHPPIENWGCLGCFYCCKYKYIQRITDWKDCQVLKIQINYRSNIEIKKNKRTHRQHFNLSDHKWEDMVIVVTDRRTKYKENSWVEVIPLYSHDLAKWLY